MTEMYKVAEDNTLRFLEGELVNTGGNCMVLISIYYDTINKRTLFISTSDECTNISTVDLIRNDIDSDLWDEMMVDSVVNCCKADWYESEYAYYIDKQILEYDLQCAKYFKSTIISYPIDTAPTEVLIKAEAVGPKYLQWLDDNNQCIPVTVETGLIYIRSAYTNWLKNHIEPAVKLQTKYDYNDAIVDDIKQLKQYLEDDYPDRQPAETIEDFDKRWDAWCTNRNVVVSYGNKSVCMPICAAAYNELLHMCNELIKEYEA